MTKPRLRGASGSTRLDTAVINRTSAPPQRTLRLPFPLGLRGPGFVVVDETYLAEAAAMQRDRSPVAPAVMAAVGGRICLIVMTDPAASLPVAIIMRAQSLGRPVLVVVCDDRLGGTSLGPAAWRCARRARAWAACAVVHGDVPRAAQYADAVQDAEANGRALLVETTPAGIQAWAESLSRCRRPAAKPASGTALF